MTDALASAKATIKTAIELKTADLMAAAVGRVKTEIAESVLEQDINFLDEMAIVDVIVEQLADYDWSGILNLVSAEVPAGSH